MALYLGIEFGSTRIKATAIDRDFRPVCSADHTWQSKYDNGVWTYELDEAIVGLRSALGAIEGLDEVEAVGISGMMHGYLAFDENWRLLTPFRTWQNTMTAPAADELTELFGFNIPQRWSIAHLYQAILNGEEHLSKIAHLTTLAGYIHHLLTGVNALGIGEASGMFPIDSEGLCYDKEMTAKFDTLAASHGFEKKLCELLPEVLTAGEEAGRLTEKGAELIGGLLKPGVAFAPPEGDAGTGMVAANAVTPGTGNISAGTSIFSMVVLEHPPKNPHREIDLVTTPAGKSVAMVHCNNCTNDSNAWIALLREAASLFGGEPAAPELYERLYKKSLEGADDCGGVLVCNYMAGESITGLDRGMPLVARRPDCNFSLANLLRATLYSATATLAIGMEILAAEGVRIDSLVGHGGFFKTPEVGQKYMAAACKAPITCMETAGEGGSYGMAVLAAFLSSGGSSLEDFLEDRVFGDAKRTTILPEKEISDGFDKYLCDFKKLIAAEKTAISLF